MGLTPEYIEGQTPLDDDEQEGLLITTITTRGELDEFEQLNIEEAIIWSLRRSFKLEDVFTESFIITLHIKMYGNVWKWAGEFRKSNKNIGVDKFEISVELNKLLNDTIYWIENKDI
jgi:Fic-DOC domain mobile mystery protein B